VGKYADPKIVQYDNDMKVEKILSLPEAEELEVSIQGELEKCCESKTITRKCCDYITVYDQDGQEIGKYTGQLNEKFTVKGDTIRVEFISDGRTAKEGFEISIAKQLMANVLNEIKEQLITIIKQVLTFGAQETLSQLQIHSEAFEQLQKQISQTTDIESIAIKVSEKLIDISKTYQTIAAKKSDIMRFHQQQFEKLELLDSRIDLYIKKLYERRNRYLDDLKVARNKLKTLKDPLEIQKIEYTIDGYSRIEQNLYTQKGLWDKFWAHEQEMEKIVRTYSQGIDVLLHFLKINAQLYQESANLALLGQFFDLKNNLSNQQELQKIINSIKDVEKKIYELITKIEKLTHPS
jgi:hypothetical protein